jgi:hypothetical protein
MAMGMILRVMDNGPIGIEPIGVSEKSATTAVRRPRSTIERILEFAFIFNFLLVTTPRFGDIIQSL